MQTMQAIQPRNEPAGDHVLLVSGSDALGATLMGALSEIGDGMPRRMKHRENLDAIADGDVAGAGAVIVDCRDEQGRDSGWRLLHRQEPGLPFVLIVPDGDRGDGLRAIMDGAQDFVEECELGERRLRRAIECSVERLRVERAMHRAHDLEKTLGAGGSAMTAGLYGLGALEQTLPGDHRFLVAEYRGVLQRVIDNYGHGETSVDSKERLTELTERIGALRGTPRDLVNIHSQALRSLLREETEQRKHAIAAEGRFVLLEAMGYLAYFYRRYSVQLPF